jgi:hypothetical protein
MRGNDKISWTFPESVNVVVSFFAVTDGSARISVFLIVPIFFSHENEKRAVASRAAVRDLFRFIFMEFFKNRRIIMILKY